MEIEIKDIVSMKIIVSLTLAMSLHRRLGANSLLRLLDPEILLLISDLVEPSFSDDPFQRLCQEIVLRYFTYKQISNFSFAREGESFHLDINFETQSGDKRYIYLIKNPSHSSTGENDGDYEDVEDEDSAEGDQHDAEDDPNQEKVHFCFRHPKLYPFIVITGEPELINRRVLCDIRLYDPRHQEETFLDGLEFDLITDEQSANHVTRLYSFPAESDDIRDVADLLFNIILSEPEVQIPPIERDPPSCPWCRAPMGEGGVPGMLCIACTRSNAADN